MTAAANPVTAKTARADSGMEERVRMLEEIVRGQDKQLAMLASNDERRMAVDQQNAVVMARLADALQNVREDMTQNRTVILDKVEDKFRALSAQVEGLHGTQEVHSKMLVDHGALLLDHGANIKSTAALVEQQGKALDDHKTMLSDHATFVRGFRWWLLATWGLIAATAIAFINHWIGHIK